MSLLFWDSYMFRLRSRTSAFPSIYPRYANHYLVLLPMCFFNGNCIIFNVAPHCPWSSNHHSCLRHSLYMHAEPYRQRRAFARASNKPNVLDHCKNSNHTAEELSRWISSVASMSPASSLCLRLGVLPSMKHTTSASSYSIALVA